MPRHSTFLENRKENISDIQKNTVDRLLKIRNPRGMDPASKIIQRLGGEAAVAKITGTAITAPYRWQYARERGGTGGLIPQRHHRVLIDFAKAHSIVLAAEDFLPPSREAG
jgi:hypothetical protein